MAFLFFFCVCVYFILLCLKFTEIWLKPPELSLILAPGFCFLICILAVTYEY